jgi:hypothetical protein
MFVSFDMEKAVAYWCCAQSVIQTLGQSCSKGRARPKNGSPVSQIAASVYLLGRSDVTNKWRTLSDKGEHLAA